MEVRSKARIIVLTLFFCLSIEASIVSEFVAFLASIVTDIKIAWIEQNGIEGNKNSLEKRR